MFFEMNEQTYTVKIIQVGFHTFAEVMKVKSNGEFQHTYIVGEARLYYKDNFNPKTGRKLALARVLDKAEKALGVTKEIREQVWTDFFKKYGV
jgi:hypothetical protein